MPKPEYDMFAFVSKALRYPYESRKKGITGKIYVKFVVDEDGKVTDVMPAHDTYELEELAEEALRVVRQPPPWRSRN